MQPPFPFSHPAVAAWLAAALAFPAPLHAARVPPPAVAGPGGATAGVPAVPAPATGPPAAMPAASVVAAEAEPVPGGPAPAVDADAEGAADDGLGPTREPPWNPPRPVPGAAAWETALRLPGRLASLPLSALGAAARAGLLTAEQNSWVPRTLYALSVLPRAGLFVAPASLGDRTGFAGAVRVQPPTLNRAAYAEWNGSTRGYVRVRAGVAGGPAFLEYAEEWRPQEPFHGEGLQSEREGFAHYAWKRQAVRLEARHAPGRGAARGRREARDGHGAGGGLRLEAGAWAGPEVRVLRRGRAVVDAAAPGRDRDDAGPIEALFPEAATSLDRRRETFAWGARLVADTRAGRPHWSRGVRLAAAAERRAGPLRGLALRDGRDLGPRFWRFTVEAETGASFGRDPRTVRLAARLVDTEVAAGSPPLDPFDLVTLGGTEGLDGFEPRRFADLDALTLRLAYVYPLIQHLEMELHAEAGGVWRDVQRDARLDRLKGSYGVLLRPRTKFAPLGEIGVTWSAEGVRARFGFGGVE